jgi:CBS domain-containing protein
MICPTCGHDNVPGSEQCTNCLHDLTQLDRPVAQDRVERSLMEDPVSVLKPGRAVTLPPTATVAEAIQTMLARNIGALLIVADSGKLLGIFSERDLLTKVAGTEPDYAAKPVRAYMTPNPETVKPTDSLGFALHKMDVGGYRHLPVIKDGQVLGMISVRNMLRHITQLCKDR